MGEEVSALCRGVWEHTPPGNLKFFLGILRLIVVQSETHLCNRPSENSF